MELPGLIHGIKFTLYRRARRMIRMSLCPLSESSLHVAIGIQQLLSFLFTHQVLRKVGMIGCNNFLTSEVKVLIQDAHVVGFKKN